MYQWCNGSRQDAPADAAAWATTPQASTDSTISSHASLLLIGDTPADVECAATHGARCLAVASGSYDRAALEATNATFCVDDLSDVQTVLGFLLDYGQHK